MKTTLTRLFTVMMLIMVSMGAKADVKVLFGENGESTFKSDAGTIEVKQETSKKDATKITVYLIVTPNKGYSMKEKDAIEAYATAPANINPTRSPQASEKLTLDCDNFKDEYSTRTYYVDIDPNLALWVKSVIFTKNSEDSSKGNRAAGPVVITTDPSNPSIYLIQSYMNTAYYMRPNTNYASTNSIVNDWMEWYFEDAGVYDGTQYYYIVNKKNEKYLCCEGTANNKNAKFESSPSTDLFKFKFVPNSSGTAYQIVVKGSSYPLVKTAAASGTSPGNWQAPGGNTVADIKVNNSNGEHSFWNFIPKSSYSKKLPHNAFVVSDASSSSPYYYKIQNNATQSLYITKGTTYVETKTNTNVNDYEWRFVKASYDDYLDYYYIIHSSGNYLRYRANIDAKENPNALELKSHTGSENQNEEQRFQFVVVRGSVSTETHDNPVITFSIVPKPVKDQRYENMFSLWSNTTAGVVETKKERNDNNNCHWNFISETPVCEDPVIAYSGDNNIRISTGTEGSTIYYTTDGSAPSHANYENSDTESGNSFIISVGDLTVVRAIAEKSGCLPSDVITFNLTVDDPVINYNTSTDQITITCGTQGASIYYTIDGSEPTTASTLYDGNGFALGNSSIIKAIAKKGGVISNIVSQSFINGLYYIKHYNKNYYMYPSTSKNGDGNPYVRTTTNQNIEAVWEIRPQGDYFTIEHYNDSKYMWTADATAKTNTVHLATAASTNDDKLLYEFSPVASLSGVYTIRPINAANEDGKNFLDTTSGDNGTNTIGLYDKGNGIMWEFVKIPSQPVITVNDIDVTITNALGDIIYTTDGTDPLTSGTATTITTNSTTTTLNYGKEYSVRAISRYTDSEATPNNHYSAESTETVEVGVEPPVISVSGTNVVTISTAQPHSEKITIRYNYDETVNNPGEPTTSTGTVWDGTTFSLTDGKAYTIKAIAYTDEGSSIVRSLTVNLKGAEAIHSLEDITDQAGNYYFDTNFTASGSPSGDIGTSTKPFKGKIDGKFVEISLGSSPLFEYVEDASIKNVIIRSSGVSTSGHAGAIANVAMGDTRIYNCGVLNGTVSGSNYVGSIVGLLDNYARVINCYSYATVSGGSDMGGIVGYNNYSSKSGDIRTMVMNCMFYGTISGSGNISPVYGGLPIHNLNGDTETGLNTYNYYRYETNKKNITAGKYNNALAAKDQYLTRFELYRQLLNGNRKLAAWYATGDANKGIGENNEMAKWVLDKSKAKYPILKSQDYYPSVVNYDPLKYYTDEGTEVQRSNVTERNKGKILGELTVNISNGGHGSIKEGKSQITLKRIDKDYGNYNFNYDKVQLPYFNEVGDGNYTGGMVVTGWKVTVSGGSNHYITGVDVTYDTNGKATDTPYNFADRKCTEKDNYDNSKRVFSQGAYFDVPYGVTSIDIEAYWGKAAYICDKYYDVVYKKDFTSGTNNIDDMGEQGNSLLTGGQTIYTAIGDDNNGALASLTGVSKPTVYDYALVLVGNLHLNDVPSNGTKPFTIMSADFDHDNEPDYSLIYTHFGETSGRKAVSPIRFDFINVPGMAMAQKPENPDADATYFRNVGIFNPKGWFEITNTCNIAFTQFEYDNGGKSAAPVILLGGEFEQFVSTQSSAPTVTQYIHIGGNAWFKEFNNGTHSDGTKFTPHIPISATGGDYDKFYLSGAYKPDADVSADDAEGYISGGRFGEVAGAGQQQIDGNVYWQIYDADITDFYGGGINSDKPITGNITIDIYNSHVTTYCGGPKFGNNDDKVTTNATGCTFTNYYGAGYGGIAYVRKRTQDATSYNFTTWVGQYTTNKGKYFDGTTKIGDNSKGEMAGPGVAVDFDYEFFVWSSGATGGRFYIKYASLSFATTNDVVSILNNCDITESFYGGGRLGKVDGTINSTLNGCRVTGNVFGAGYSAERPKVPYRNGGFKSADDIPSIDTNAGVFADGVKSTNIEELELNPGQELKNGILAIGTSGKIDTDFTEDQLKALGTVSGVVTLNINNYTVGNNTIKTKINGDVFGGGAMSKTTSNVNVNISGGSVGNVYGGGDEGAVGGNTIVTLSGSTTVNGNVYGGGNGATAVVSGSATVNIE